jgi:hypothetical protein
MSRRIRPRPRAPDESASGHNSSASPSRLRPAHHLLLRRAATMSCARSSSCFTSTLSTRNCRCFASVSRALRRDSKRYFRTVTAPPRGRRSPCARAWVPPRTAAVHLVEQVQRVELGDRNQPGQHCVIAEVQLAARSETPNAIPSSRRARRGSTLPDGEWVHSGSGQPGAIWNARILQRERPETPVAASAERDICVSVSGQFVSPPARGADAVSWNAAPLQPARSRKAGDPAQYRPGIAKM